MGERWKLIQARLARHLKQAEIAKYIGCSVHAVSQWEQGKADPRRERVVALCTLFQKQPAELDLVPKIPRGVETMKEGAQEGVEPAEEMKQIPLGDRTILIGEKEVKVARKNDGEDYLTLAQAILYLEKPRYTAVIHIKDWEKKGLIEVKKNHLSRRGDLEIKRSQLDKLKEFLHNPAK